MVAALAAAAVLALGIASPAAAAAKPKPVPSLQPRATAKLWRKLVQPRRLAASAADCTPLRLVFYSPTDWLRLATKLAANEAQCAEYYVSVPPLAADKTNFRPDQPWRIRALGPNFHAICEISYNGWSSWVNTTGASWYDAGVEARRRMAAQGFDVTRGRHLGRERVVVGRSPGHGQRAEEPARPRPRSLRRGRRGAGSKGAVYVIGAAGQANTSLSLYKGTLEMWLGDTAFWNDMSAYVSDWSQESYGDFRNYAVAGASLETRRDELNAWLQHPLALANAGPGRRRDGADVPPDARTARSPTPRGATRRRSAGRTSHTTRWRTTFRRRRTPRARPARTSASRGRRSGRTRETITQFSIESGALVDRLAAAIHDSAEAPAGPRAPGGARA